MKNFISSARHTWILSLVLAAGSMLPTENVLAQQEPEPSAIIAIASVDSQLKDVEYLASATSEAIGQMSGLIRFQAQGFLPGVDFTKPAGALLYFEDGKPEPNAVGFFPVKNIDDILDKISEYAEVEEDGEVVTIIPDNGEELSLVSHGGYAFVSAQAKLLKNLPSDPASLVAAQSKQYNISAKVFPQRIPEDLRNQALDFIRDGFESAIDQMEDLQAGLQEAQFEMQMKQFEMMINELETLTVGLNADKDSESMYLDFNMKGVANSEIEKRLAAAKTSTPSHFAGFLMDKAAFTFHNCSGISKEDAKLYIESLENARDTLLDEIEEDGDGDQHEAELLSKIANELSGIIKKTLMAGTLDMGGVIYTDTGLNAAFGAKVVDARKLESSIKEIVAEAESKIENDEVVFNLNSGSHGGFDLHEILVNVDEEDLDDAFEALFGDKITALLAIGDDQVYLGFGKNPESVLKKSIDANAGSPVKNDLIGQFNFFIAPIMNLVAQLETEEEMVETLRDKIVEAGKDRVRVTYDVVDGEMRVRLDVQDGIFQMFGVAAESMGGMGGGRADF